MFTSDLKRAIESSGLAFPEVEKIADKRLRECNYGDLEGKHKSLVIYEEHVEDKFTNGESYAQACENLFSDSSLSELMLNGGSINYINDDDSYTLYIVLYPN